MSGGRSASARISDAADRAGGETPLARRGDHFTVQIMRLNEHVSSGRATPAAFEMVPAGSQPSRDEEKRALRRHHEHWQAAYGRSLGGWDRESGIFLLLGGRLVAGLYVCRRNEFNDDEGSGQMHYGFVDPSVRGRGLYGVMFGEAIRRARSWGLRQVYLNTDRPALAEVHERWGATRWRTIPKQLPAPTHRNLRHYNWLVYQIHDEILIRYLKRYAWGTLIDVGCGSKPYANVLKPLVAQHIGIDHPRTPHSRDGLDVLATAYHTALAPAVADTILCTAVLEHLERPESALREFFRILKPGGHVILTAPFFWHLHEQPRDFFRFTAHGLEYLLTAAGFRSVEVKPLAGLFVTLSQESAYLLEGVGGRITRPLRRGIQTALLVAAHWLHRRGRDRAHSYTWAHLAVARRPS